VDLRCRNQLGDLGAGAYGALVTLSLDNSRANTDPPSSPPGGNAIMGRILMHSLASAGDDAAFSAYSLPALELSP